jgi:hypothetical protein
MLRSIVRPFARSLARPMVATPIAAVVPRAPTTMSLVPSTTRSPIAVSSNRMVQS